MSGHLMKAYAPQPVAFSRGEGVWLWDAQGKKYLDALCGIAVVSLGHAHPKVTQVISEQAARLMQVSNGFDICEQQDLADRLAELTGLDKAFFCSTGAEANEAAIKIARLYGNRCGIKNPQIVVMGKAFHGRTMATITASASPVVQAGFEPLLDGFIRCPYNDLNALQDVLQSHDNIVAVMLEPIQGEGGLHIPDQHYLPGVRELCDQYQAFMILDEVQTGVGRTGKLYAYQHHHFLPDIITSAKALGNGYPVAFCMATGKAADVFQVGNHGTTFGGSPMASRVAHTVIDLVAKPSFLAHVNHLGDYLLNALRERLAHHPHVVEIRGQGLMIGIELNQPCMQLRGQGLAMPGVGLVFNVTAKNVIRLVPPLVMQEAEADMLVDGLDKLIGSL